MIDISKEEIKILNLEENRTMGSKLHLEKAIKQLDMGIKFEEKIQTERNRSSSKKGKMATPPQVDRSQRNVHFELLQEVSIIIFLIKIQSEDFESSGTGLLFNDRESDNVKSSNVRSIKKLFTLELPQPTTKVKSINLSQKEQQQMNLDIKGGSLSSQRSKRPQSYHDALSVIESAISDIEKAKQQEVPVPNSFFRRILKVARYEKGTPFSKLSKEEK